ncbi:hypothetical protein KBD75_00335 [Candidatus Woesebacteria bacterium]|nr:hypothetical protein [Candidatus Woesebacteria bacterium]
MPKKTSESVETREILQIFKDKDLDQEEKLITFYDLQVEKLTNKTRKNRLIQESSDRNWVDFIPWQIAVESDVLFKDMGIKELNLLADILSDLHCGDDPFKKFMLANAAINGAIGILKNINSKPKP